MPPSCAPFLRIHMISYIKRLVPLVINQSESSGVEHLEADCIPQQDCEMTSFQNIGCGQLLVDASLLL